MDNYEYRNMDEARGCIYRNMGEQKGREYRKKVSNSCWLSLLFEAITCFGVVGAMFFSRKEGYYAGINTMTNGSLDDSIVSDVHASGDTIADE